MLNITERQSADVTILDLEGNIIMGGGSAQLRDAMRRLIEEGKKNVLLNFARVKYVDSSGVGELVTSFVTLNRAGGNLKLANLPERVEQVMTLSSVKSIFDIYDNESEALAGHSPES